MPRIPQPRYRANREHWYVEFGGKQHNLGPNKATAYQRYYELMRQKGKPAPDKAKITTAAHEYVYVDELVAEFLEWCEKKRATDTYLWYRDRLRVFVAALPKDAKIEDLNTGVIERWVDDFDVSDGTKRNLYRAILRPFNWAMKKGRLLRSPLVGIEKPAQGKREFVISDSLYASILTYVRDKAFEDLLTVAWETGARPQELTRLEVRHVDIDRELLRIPTIEAKGKREDRIVYLSPESTDIIRRLAGNRPANARVFLNTHGKAWTPDAVNCQFSALQLRMGKDAVRQQSIIFAEDEIAACMKTLKQTTKRKTGSRRKTEKELRAEAYRKLVRQQAPKLCLYHFRHTWINRV